MSSCSLNSLKVTFMFKINSNLTGKNFRSFDE